MRIIKHGNLPGDSLYTCTCMNCKTEFEFTRNEANYICDQRDGDCLQILCPVCGLFCYVAVKNKG